MLAFLKRVIAGRYRIMLKATEQGMVALSMCQSDPMVVPFGGTSNYFGTNPIAFAPRAGHEPVVFDMATTVQAWGKF